MATGLYAVPMRQCCSSSGRSRSPPRPSTTRACRSVGASFLPWWGATLTPCQGSPPVRSHDEVAGGGRRQHVGRQFLHVVEVQGHPPPVQAEAVAGGVCVDIGVGGVELGVVVAVER